MTQALPGVPLTAFDVHSAPLPRPGYPLVPQTVPTGQFTSKCMTKIRRPRLDRPQLAYTAASLAAMYGFPKLTAPSNQWVAIISLGGGISNNDVSAYCQQYGFPVPPIRIISVDGGTNAYSGDPNSADGENALDVQNVIGATGGKVGILLYCCPNSGSGFADGVMQVARDNVACVCTISWGSTESNNTAQDRASMDAALQACLANGIPVFAASGDDGSSDGGTGNNADYPSSSPYAIGCGGTSLTSGKETAWSYGGGGPSHIYAKPSWQTAAPGNMRGVPDVSLNADPNSGFPIVMNSQWQTFGGTSAVGPMWAAAVALVVSITGKRLTNFVQGIYAKNLLTDIITGSNGAFQAGVNYDYCTGQGVPNAAFFASLTNSAPPPVSPPPVSPPPVSPPPVSPPPPVPPPMPPPTVPAYTLAEINTAFAALESRFGRDRGSVAFLKSTNAWIDAWLTYNG